MAPVKNLNGAVCEISAIAFAVAFGALTVAGFAILRLAYAERKPYQTI